MPSALGVCSSRPKALGNHAAIITEYNEPLMTKLKAFLEDVGYTGFANFDIKYDSRDGSYRVFEINLRQGRSNYYVTGAGLNIARYVVEDRVLGSDLGPCVMNEKETFWHSVPRAVVYKYVKDPAFVEKARRLVREGLFHKGGIFDVFVHHGTGHAVPEEIGRASCRERV